MWYNTKSRLKIGVNAKWLTRLFLREVMKNKVEKDLTKNKIIENFDYKYRYDDKFYEDYINSFKANDKKRYFYKFVKRFFDFLSSLIFLIILSPLFIILAIP